VVWVKNSGKQFFLAPVFFQRRPNDMARALWPGLRYTDDGDFLMWALIGQRGEFVCSDEQLLTASERELHRLALKAVEGCHPMLRTLVEAATPDRSFSLAIRALPVVDPWPSSRITFLGDAIHASPVNGTGANAALEDAALLCRHLIRGQAALQWAVDEYEMELLKRVRAMRAGLAQARPLMLSM
jgi:2-polyprenyl-6-methoxyphenol hydroxylase-like FAD-dependent oxidoreductase